METILKILFKPGQLFHAIYILITGKVVKQDDQVVTHMNLWIMSTMFWATILFIICWLAVLALFSGF